MSMNMQERIGQYVKLRDYKGAAKKEFDAKMKRVNEAMQKLEGEFLEALNDQGINSLNTDTGTAYKIPRTSCSVKDRDAFFRFAIQQKNLELLDIRANKGLVGQLLKDGTDVPGVNYTESIQIGVRRGKDDE